jgi:hypothetical protein
VAAVIRRTGAAAAVAVEAGDGFESTRLELSPEDIAFGHGISIGEDPR